MKKIKFPFMKKEDRNRGAALIAVLVTVIFIGTIAAIITTVTVTNIRMKAIEKGSRENFYTSDSVIDALTSGIGAKALEELDAAYQDVMGNYASYTADDAQDLFAREYIDALISVFQHVTTDPADPSDATGLNTNTDPDTGLVTAQSAKYNTDTVKECLPAGVDTVSDWFATSDGDAFYVADYTEQTFTLKNIKVKEMDSQGYETTIQTDIVLSTPSLELTGAVTSQAYMNYSLIADTDIKFDTPNVTVGGNVYAGTGGIISAYMAGSGTPSLTGDVIITRGDIVSSENGTSLSVGNGSSSIWAENITIGGDSTSFDLNGKIYIADDLEVNGADSSIELNGSYYGYNFQENYGSLSQTSDAAYSSAIIINNLNSSVDLTGLNYLMLAGRTFISRNIAQTSNDEDVTYGNIEGEDTGAADVFMGESLSVQSNQLAYYVSNKYLELDDDGDPVKDENGNYIFNFSEDGLAAYESATGVSDLMDYLNTSQPLVPYYYTVQSATDGTSEPAVNCYLNFASEDSANKFFTAYMAGSKSSSITNKAEDYLANDAIIINDSLAYALRGDLMFRTEAMAEGATDSNLSVRIGDAWGKGSALWDTSVSLARQYKALELTLSNTSSEATADNVRIGNNKEDESLFDYIVYTDTLKNNVGGGINVSPKSYDDLDAKAVVVNNEGKGTYSVPSNFDKGLVLASGDVYIDHNFEGLIICGGEITFGSNATISSDADLIMDLFDADMAGDNYFAIYFRAFNVGTTTGTASANIDISEYLGYANWTKNTE
ncbi:MAG: hypothetical protein LUI02_02435 [Clostridiales bacterium]|nr:hypothetical protein [Clostridiales bacterium]